jgi:hypothetical protein
MKVAASIPCSTAAEPRRVSQACEGDGRGAPASQEEDPLPKPSTTAEVIILGAGAAGLGAARRLARAGGRIHTRHPPSVPVPVELGAEFIHGRPPNIWRTLEKRRDAV